MVHTTFCGADCRGIYNAIKEDLRTIIDQNPDESELLALCKYFADKY